MSYLNLPDGIPGFNKAVISLWFRVPTESLKAMLAQSDAEGAAAGGGDHPVYPRLRNVLPLMTFGELFEGYQIEGEASGEATFTETHWVNPHEGVWEILGTPEVQTYSTGESWTKVGGFHANPSYVGVVKGADNDDGTNTFQLEVFIQSRDHGSPSNVALVSNWSISDKNTGAAISGGFATEEHWDYRGLASFCKTGVPAPGNPWMVHNIESDNSALVMKTDGPDSFTAGFGIEVKPDTWHHVLISFDLSKGTSTQGFWSEIHSPGCAPAIQTVSIDATYNNPCKMWIAFDDKNRGGDDIHGFNPYPFTGQLGPNDILSRNSFRAANASNGISQDLSWEVEGCVEDYLVAAPGRSSYSYPAGMLPSAGFDLGIPAGANMVDHIYRVEMAELQIFTGVFVDTASTTARRAFVGKDGKPVPPTQKGETDPVTKQVTKDSGSIDLLGKWPEILLHGSANWKKGISTGQPDPRRPGKKDNSQEFTPTGGIETYKPDPSLSGDQGKQEKPKAP